MIKGLLTLLSFLVLSLSAQAQLSGTDIKPGDPCTASEEGYVARNASADRDISEITLICDGNQWQSATGAGGADNLGNHTATQTLTLGSNWISSSGGNSGLKLDAASGASLTEASAGNQTTLLVGNGATNSRSVIRALNAGDDTQNITLHASASQNTGAFIIANGINRSVSGEGGGGILLETARNSTTGTLLFRTQGADRLTIAAGGDITATGSLTASSFAGTGTLLTALNATNLSSGTVPAARMGSGTANSTTYLRGDNTWATPTFSLPALTSANIWVGNGSNAATAVAMSGDATLSNAGVLTIGSNAVGSAEITNASIALADLSATGTASVTTYLRGDNTWATVPSGADNLGNHTATTALDMANNSVVGADNVTLDNHLYLIDANGADSKTAALYSYNDQLYFRRHTAGTNAYEANVAYLNLTNGAFTASVFSGSGASLTNLNASSLSTGTVATARLGTGTANSSVFLRGDGTWAAPVAGDAPTLDGLDSAQFLRSDADDSTSGRLIGAGGGLPASQVMATATGSLGSYEARSQGSSGTAGAAFITFHRPGSYAAYLGLDTDNKWKVGGWSMGANSYEIFHQGKNIDLQGMAMTSSAGTIRDANGGWVRTYGDTGWYNGTHAGGWHMQDSTWLRAYGGKAVYTTNVMRADSGIRTNQVCDINGANCVAQGSLGGGGGGGISAATNVSCTVAASSGQTCAATCPAGYFAASATLIAGADRYPCAGTTPSTATNVCWYSSAAAASIANSVLAGSAKTVHVRCLK